MNTQPLTSATCIVRNTAARKGRTLAIVPGGNETGFVCLGGGATTAFTLDGKVALVTRARVR